MKLMPPHRPAALESRGDFPTRDTMGLILLLVVLVFLFGGGGFYMGPPFHYFGGGLSTIMEIAIIGLLLLVWFPAKSWRYLTSTPRQELKPAFCCLCFAGSPAGFASFC